MTIEQDLQKLTQTSSVVELFTMDLTRLGGSVYYFTPRFSDGGAVAFGGDSYQSWPIQATGFDVSSDGTQPRPVLELSSLDGMMLADIIAKGDLVGAKVTRKRTLETYLDNGATPDSSQYMNPIDVFYIEQRLAMNDLTVKYQLSGPLDKFGTKLPRQQFTRSEFPAIGRSGGW